ncbi:DinB family protein [Alteribacter natronophilus]|uniref:DinB family protein n=1 Tax=Alteribacter natronophilus TaxID=2583810 RepID=UPI001486734C|nr:DinB family protein [Alteribacter natronophilus]
MNRHKQEILVHYEQSIEFADSLRSLSEDEWRTPIAKGKWTVAEVVGHFIPWDRFVLHQRLPYFFSTDQLPKGPDAEETNHRAAAKAREESRQSTIDTFVSVRTALCEAIEEIPEEKWERNFTIGKTTLSLSEYFKGLKEHDEHHFAQIDIALK